MFRFSDYSCHLEVSSKSMCEHSLCDWLAFPVDVVALNEPLGGILAASDISSCTTD